MSSTAVVGEAVVGEAIIGEEEAAPPPPVESNPAPRPPGPTDDVTVRLQALDGTWETCGADRAIGVNAQTLQATANEWGPDKASFELRRSAVAIWPDLGAFTPVEVEVGGVQVWEGRIEGTPLRASDMAVSVQCEGWQHHLDDDVYQRVYVHSKLTDWKDARSPLTANLTVMTGMMTVGVQQGAITLTYPQGSSNTAIVAAGAVLDLGEAAAKRLVATCTTSNNAEVLKIFIIGHDTPAWTEEVGREDFATNIAVNAGAEHVFAATVTKPHRYVTLLLYTSVAASSAADVWVKFTDVKVFAATAYESGNASVLKASQIIPDALANATLLLSPDVSQVAATTFAIPDFVLSKQSTPREAIEAANAYHNWVTKLLSGRRFNFQPRPTDPTLELGAWSGAELEDASANSGAELYSRAVAEAQAPDGSPVLTERSASQQPGAVFTVPSSPVADNPSFTTNTEHWTGSGGTLTRNTEAAHYNTSPGSAKFVVASHGVLTGTFSGTFRKGVQHKISFWAQGLSNQQTFVAALGTETDFATGTYHGAVGTIKTITWTPTADRTGVTLAITLGTAAGFYLDDITVAVAEVTLPERRGFRRTKVIHMSSAITTAEGDQLADTFLQGHIATPFKGSAAVFPGGIRRVQGGQPVHPAQLLLHTQELVRLSHLIDPDTGAVGRDATIAEVAYAHKERKATVTLDDKRANFDALLARLAVVQTPGS